jgi:hypothetical protein
MKSPLVSTLNCKSSAVLLARRLLILALALVPALGQPGLISQALAQGGHANHGGGALGEILEGGCQQKLGDRFQVNLSAYPADSFNYESLCGEVPLGETFLTVDLVNPELREMPVGLQVVQVAADNAPERTIHEVPAVTHPRGSIETSLTFPASGDYAVIVTATNSHTMSARFPLHVGGGGGIALWLGIMAALALVAGGAYWFKTRKPA